jgi:hypothetical protein
LNRELAFSKFKRLLRSAGARTVDSLWDAISQSSTNPADNGVNYLRDCCYAHSDR